MPAPWIINLNNLQDKDLRIRTLESKLALIPKEKLELKNQAAANRQQVEDAKNSVLAAQMKLKQSESRINSHKEMIHKLETQSNMVKKNTEYQAMLQQIADYRKKIGEEESLGIALLDEIEAGKQKYREIAENTKYLNISLKSEFDDLDTLANDIKTELAALKTEREKLAAHVDSAVLSRYESLLKRADGKPLVPIKDGICGNCHLRITPQTLNSAMKSMVTFCDNCQHFIYTED